MIRFLDLKLVNQRYYDVFKKSFDNFLNNGHYILGEQVIGFEKEFAAYCGTKHCIGVSNGLDALELIFEAYKTLGVLKVNDEVIVPANTYIASVLSISNSGLRPVLVEPNINTFNIDPSLIEKAITSKTKAILGVHLYGRLYDVEQLEKIAINNNLVLIEDAAQAHGAATIDGRKAGNVSNAAAFSFYPTKNLGALADAGAVTTNDKALADVIFKMRHYGRASSYENDIKGRNCRLDEIQAAFLRIKLKHLKTDNIRRQGIARTYFELTKNEKIILPHCKILSQHVFHLFVIRSNKRDLLREYLYKNGVESIVHYPIPIHHQKAYQEFGSLKLPITEQIHNEVLSVPLNTGLNSEQVLKIVKLINSF
ncbi:DegT/DnrJ/EryC1/StrS family aminotransferase [Hwangdonia seohaensis]|uniref:DegT/DnrJ/EryC1/StrS family aminotransferase n=1 Tax=Hwangdonia seohaensis TaxID=1240727 RepID=A0ABW3RG37_9FLAO|nr:DegT/DnrJ/EryC1/StrS family aminotransferase [Hwangdonia seohaensis]